MKSLILNALVALGKEILFIEITAGLVKSLNIFSTPPNSPSSRTKP